MTYDFHSSEDYAGWDKYIARVYLAPWTHSYSYINSTATHSSYLTYSFKIASWYIHESSLNPCNLPWCRCNLLKLRHTEIDAYVSSCTYNFKRKVAHLVTTPKHLCCEAVFRPVLFSLVIGRRPCTFVTLEIIRAKWMKTGEMLSRSAAVATCSSKLLSLDGGTD